VQLPAVTQVLDFTKDKRVLTITIPVRISVTNYLGGFSRAQSTSRPPAKFTTAGSMTAGPIHARRSGWIQ
jgi:hypothetical protein